MANPFASIWEDVPAPAPIPEKPKPKPKPKPDHSEARAIYERYKEKAAILRRYQAYAEKVAKATDGPGMTPVMPLATMGCNGGPLLCDHCLRPIILESSPYYNVPADEAWNRAPAEMKSERWKSWIKGGMVVRIVENGTLRIYHGYQGRGTDCCDKAEAEQNAAEAKFVKDTSKIKLLVRFIEDELPNENLNALLTDIVNVMFSFDPGLGVNAP